MKIPEFVQSILRRYDEQNGPLLAKGLSFNFLLGFLPMIFLAFWTAALLVDLAPGLQEILEAEVVRALPGAMHELVNNQISHLGRSKGTLGLITLFTFVVTVFFLFESLERTVRTMVGGQGRSWLKTRAINLMMVVGSIIFVYTAALFSVVGRVIKDMGFLPPRLLSLGAPALSIIIIGLFFAFCEYIYLQRKVELPPLLLISLGASAAWFFAAAFSGTLVRTAGRRFVVYGAITGAVTYTMFLRILAEIVIFATLLIREFALKEEGEQKEAMDGEDV